MRKDERLNLAGVLLPVTTPFDVETGDVAPVSFRDNIRRWAQAPVQGFVLFGSTGEGALLDESEKLKLVEYSRDVIPHDRIMLGGVSGESTRAAIREARHLAEAGVDGVLVHAPVYFSPLLSSGHMRDFFTAVADASPVPVIVYHMPKLHRFVIEPGLIAELSKHPNIVGVKDSSGEVKRLAEFVASCQEGSQVLVGNGALLYTALELGAVGGILALALLAAGECVAMHQHFREGDTRRAGRLQERLAGVHREVVAQFGAPGVKVGLDLLGMAGGPPRAPLGPLSEKDRRQVARVMQESGLIPAAPP